MSGFHDIDIVVGGYYTGTEDQVVEVAEPDDTHITAVGETVMSASAGIYKATNGTKMGFGLNVKYRDGKRDKWWDWRKKESLSGHVDVTFKSGGKTYLIKSDDFDSLGVDFEKSTGGSCNGPTSSKCYGLADIRMTAKLVDVTKWWKTSTVASEALPAGHADRQGLARLEGLHRRHALERKQAALLVQVERIRDGRADPEVREGVRPLGRPSPRLSGPRVAQRDRGPRSF